jgi:TRAP-type C4-dicarboxylate transport system permease small subunit
MDALVLDIAVQILSALSVALLAWGGWLCIGATSSQGHPTGAAERAQASFS